MKSVPVKIDVSAAVGAERPQHIAGTVFFPDEIPTEHPLIIFASPGGGYTQHYFNMRFPGHEGYSQAEYHACRGTVFVAMDHLGVGESSVDLIDELSVEMIADGNHIFVREITKQLEEGSLGERQPKLIDPYVVGIGQSMGGGITMIMQGRHETFDAIAPLGISAIHTVLPQPTPELFASVRSIFLFSRQTPLNELSVKFTSDLVPDFLYPFHWEDEPVDIIAADMEGGYPLRRAAPPFGSLTVPRCAVAMNSPGFFTPDAARITVPVLLAGGERDVMPDVMREPTAFINSSDVSVFVVPRMAHMHNFANTRTVLWQKIEDWARMQSGSPAPIKASPVSG